MLFNQVNVESWIFIFFQFNYELFRYLIYLDFPITVTVFCIFYLYRILLKQGETISFLLGMDIFCYKLYLNYFNFFVALKTVVIDSPVAYHMINIFIFSFKGLQVGVFEPNVQAV